MDGRRRVNTYVYDVAVSVGVYSCKTVPKRKF